MGARRLKHCGWVANRITADMPCFEENLAALEEGLTAPLLGVIAANSTPEQAAMRLSFPLQVSVASLAASRLTAAKPLQEWVFSVLNLGVIRQYILRRVRRG